VSGSESPTEQPTERLQTIADVPASDDAKDANADAVDALFAEASRWTKAESVNGKAQEGTERITTMREEFRAVDTQLQALEAKEGRSTDEDKELLRLQVDSARLINVYRQQFGYSDHLDKTGARLGHEGMRQAMNKSFGIRLPVYQEGIPFQPAFGDAARPGIDTRDREVRKSVARMQLYAWKDISAALSRVQALDPETRKRLMQEGMLERRAFETTSLSSDGTARQAALTEAFNPMVRDLSDNIQSKVADFSGLPDLTWTDGSRHSGEVLSPSASRSSNNWLNALVIDKLAREQGLYEKAAA
jgi:hypothetical protein